MDDEMKIVFNSVMTRKLIGGMLEKSIRKKFGYDVKVDIQQIAAELVGGAIHAKICAEAVMEEDELIGAATLFAGE